MAKLKRDDEVIVIAGKDKGKRGTVRRIIDSDRVVVSGVNMIKNTPSPTRRRALPVALLNRRRLFRHLTWRYLIASPGRASVWVTASTTAKRFAYSSRPAIWLTPDRRGEERQ